MNRRLTIFLILILSGIQAYTGTIQNSLDKVYANPTIEGIKAKNSEIRIFSNFEAQNLSEKKLIEDRAYRYELIELLVVNYIRATVLKVDKESALEMLKKLQVSAEKTGIEQVFFSKKFPIWLNALRLNMDYYQWITIVDELYNVLTSFKYINNLQSITAIFCYQYFSLGLALKSIECFKTIVKKGKIEKEDKTQDQIKFYELYFNVVAGGNEAEQTIKSITKPRALLRPENQEYQLGYFYFRNGNFEAARKELEKLNILAKIQSNHNLPLYADFLKVRMLIIEGQLPEAQKIIKSWDEKMKFLNGADLTRLLVIKGYYHLKTNEIDLAINNLKQAKTSMTESLTEKQYTLALYCGSMYIKNKTVEEECLSAAKFIKTGWGNKNVLPLVELNHAVFGYLSALNEPQTIPKEKVNANSIIKRFESNRDVDPLKVMLEKLIAVK